MRIFVLTIVLIGLGTAAQAWAQPDRAATKSPSDTPPYRGTFEYRYGTFVLHVECNDDEHLSWTVRNGPSETVVVDRRQIAAGIYLTSWTEKSGAIVAQVANYEAGTLNSVLIVNGQRTVLTGTIQRLTP